MRLMITLVTIVGSLSGNLAIAQSQNNQDCFMHWSQDATNIDQASYEQAIKLGISHSNATVISTNLSYLDVSNRCTAFRTDLKNEAIAYLAKQSPAADCKVVSMGAVIIDCLEKTYVNGGIGPATESKSKRENR
jgi:hypothetical protein